MDRTYCLLLGCIFIAAIASQTDALRCYNCNNLDDNGCDDPFSSASELTGCVQCVKVKGTKSSLQVVARICAPERLPVNGCESKTEQGITGEACVCETDLCNSSVRVAASATLLMILSFYITVHLM
ncbi:hypothetical protein DPMN_150796 [Dreissena polymorpha]|uniref:Protein quiver n=1 Tax=Dreissena polymorpha TaxID=45954 RepID=A0A9D4FGD2_DREPO|nr:hypothetical protein DPMN_150796 [Dreissena polymorpha]